MGTSKLLDMAKQHEKLFKIDDAIFCAVAGLTSDANVLINKLRLTAQQHKFTYGDQISVEKLVTSICDLKQGYTQFGGLRPYGVSFLIAGYDKHYGMQLYDTNPSGNFNAWRAHAIGTNSNTAQATMRQDWTEGMKKKQILDLAAKVLVKTMDTATPDATKIEMGVVEMMESGEVRLRLLKDTEVNKLMADNAPKEGEEGE